MPRGIGTRAPAGMRAFVTGLDRGRASRRRSRPPGRAPRRMPRPSQRDAHLVPPVAVPLRDAERQVVEQLVGEHDGVDRHLREVRERREHRSGARAPAPAPRRLVRMANGPSASSAGSIGRSSRCCARSDGRPLDEHVPQRGEAVGRGAPDLAREPTVARARLDDEERIGRAERSPRAVERARDARAEQRADLRDGHEVAPGATRAAPASRRTRASAS